MSYYKEVYKLLGELRSGAVLKIDNDCCYTSFEEDEKGDSSYEFDPKELAFIFGGYLLFNVTSV